MRKSEKYELKENSGKVATHVIIIANNYEAYNINNKVIARISLLSCNKIALK